MSTKTECVHRKTIDLSKTITSVKRLQATGTVRDPNSAKGAKLPDVLICINVS